LRLVWETDSRSAGSLCPWGKIIPGMRGDDAWRDIGLSLLGLALFSAFLNDRAERTLRRDLECTWPGSRFQVRLEPSGLYGALAGRVFRGTVRGEGIRTEDLPFRVEPGGGLQGRLRTLRLDLSDLTLRGVPFRSLSADIPDVRVDAWRGFASGHLTIRRAGEGTAIAQFTEEGLQQYLQRRRPALRELRLRLRPEGAEARATATLFVAPASVTVRAQVEIEDGRRINAVGAKVYVDDRLVAPALADRLMQMLNPLIDVERDLGLGDWVRLTHAELGDGLLTVYGSITIPNKPARVEKHP